MPDPLASGMPASPAWRKQVPALAEERPEVVNRLLLEFLA